jgi:hypothetical protein
LKGVMKARDRSEKTQLQDDSRQPVMRVNLAGSSTDIAYGYVKRDCVFRVTAEEGDFLLLLFIYLLFIYLLFVICYLLLASLLKTLYLFSSFSF